MLGTAVTFSGMRLRMAVLQYATHDIGETVISRNGTLSLSVFHWSRYHEVYNGYAWNNLKRRISQQNGDY